MQAVTPLPSSDDSTQSILNPARFLFVGERPSSKAERLGATWQNGKLAGKTLREALFAASIDPVAQRFINLYRFANPSRFDARREATVCRAIVRYQKRGLIVVALGRLVSKRLTIHGLDHISMIHPAARGSNRRRERYQAHVADTLAQAVRGTPPCQG